MGLFSSLLTCSLTLGISFASLGAQRGLLKSSAVFAQPFGTPWGGSWWGGSWLCVAELQARGVNLTRPLGVRRARRPPHFAHRDARVAQQTRRKAAQGRRRPFPGNRRAETSPGTPTSRTVRRPNPHPPTLFPPQPPRAALGPLLYLPPDSAGRGLRRGRLLGLRGEAGRGLPLQLHGSLVHAGPQAPHFPHVSG